MEEKYIRTNKFVYFSFFLFGTGGWLAWNALIAGLDFFDSRLGSKYDPSFFFGFIFMWAGFVSNFLVLYLSDKVSLSIKIYIAFGVVMVWTMSSCFITEYLQIDLAWYILLISIALNAVANSFLQTGLTGFASIFPSYCLNALTLGQGLNGFMVNCMKMIFLVVLPPDEDKGKDDMNAYYDSIIYISFSVILLVFWIIFYKLLISSKFARHYTLKSGLKEDRIVEQKGLIDTYSSGEKIQDAEDYRTTQELNVDRPLLTSKDESVTEKLSWMNLYKQVFFLVIQWLIVYSITFLIYPGTLLETRFDFLNNNKSSKAWFNLIMLTLFSIGDTLGRFLGGIFKIFGPKTVIFFTLSRLIFVATSVLIQLQESPGWLFRSDWFRLVNMFLFSVTNGYNITIVLVYAPQQVDIANKERVGLLANFHAASGWWIGAMLAAFGMNYIPKKV